MSPSDKTERVRLRVDEPQRSNLNVLLMEKRYGGKASMKVVGIGTFSDKKGDKPRLDLDASDGQEWYFVLNRTNADVIADTGLEYVDELIGKTLTLETYETGGVGNFAFGIRIVEVK